MVGSHTQTVNINRVPYCCCRRPARLLQRAGPQRFHRLGNYADERWIEAQVQAFAQSITLSTPASVEAGRRPSCPAVSCNDQAR